MDSFWMKPLLSEEIMINNNVNDTIPNIITDIVSGRIDITHLVENMGGVLTDPDAANREKGMKFFTGILKELPKDYLTEMQVKFIFKFYVDRLKDNHRVIPTVLEGYLSIINMKNYNINLSGEFLTVLFREVPCQSQVRQDRYHIYLIVKTLLEKNVEYTKALGPDFVYGVISAMDGERDPRNLMFLFSFLPTFLKHVPLGHLVEEMFDVISCYYPIDFHPSPDDPAAVTRQDLATALAPCLCAVQEFAEQCLVLLIEKLDSSLRLAKIDSLKLLTESCKTLKSESYAPFLKSLWSSINREIVHKTDEELKMAAHEALSTLVAKLSTTANTDQAFENFVKAILITIQTSIAEANTVIQFHQAAKILLTTANASKESCVIITKQMIPAVIAYYDFKTAPKLQIASLDFLGDLYELAKHWSVLEEVELQVKEIPQLCLTAVSKTSKEYQIAGFKTLIRVQNELQSDLIVPFVEVLIHNIQFCHDNDLLKISVETVHAIARKYPELIMNLVVKGKCDIENLTKDTHGLQKRLYLLTNLASIDDFTKIIIEEMLKLLNDTEATKVVEALSENMSNTSLFSNDKVAQIESDHGLIESILNWVQSELENGNRDLTHGYTLISNTISSLPVQKQVNILQKHTAQIKDKCAHDHKYFLVIECLYSALNKELYDSTMGDILNLSFELALYSENELVRTKACTLIAHALNKAEPGQKFELIYELLKNYLSSSKRQDSEDKDICPNLIILYGWVAKALLLRGSDIFQFWLQKIVNILSNPAYCNYGAESIRLIMLESEYLTTKQHCRISLLYKQRMFQTFTNLTETIVVEKETKEAYLLSWAYVLEKAPKSLLINEANKICPILVDSLEYDNKDLLQVTIDVLCHYAQAKHHSIADSLQTILPRLVNLTTYVKSMDVRIKSLQCLYEIANSYRTSLLLPHKQDILLDLAPSLDDKKRLVRNMAVKARTRWFLIGAPGESKEN